MSGNPALSTHPCYSENAHRFYSRLHLPVAPKCNIQCNYCHRKHDCVNESRPGVTSRLLSPEQAFQRVMMLATQRRDLSVVGIAGPGDALANPEKTFATYRLIRQFYPDLHLCLSTNGLDLVNHLDQLIALEVKHVTVTVNTMDPETAESIYAWIKIDRKKRRDQAAYKEFMTRQQLGIRELTKAGILVKVNSLLIPGINDTELPSLAKRLKLMGVALHNIMPLIARPEHGSLFGIQNRPTPTHEELEEVRKSCGITKQMTHCRQCRADAAGKLRDETIIDKEKFGNELHWVEADYGFEKRQHWRRLVSHLLVPQSFAEPSLTKGDAVPFPEETAKIAVCSQGSGFADLDLKSATEIMVYQQVNRRVTLLNVRKIEKNEAIGFSERLMQSITGCKAIISSKIGYQLFKELESAGIMPITDLSSIPVEKAVSIAIKRLGQQQACTSKPTQCCAESR